MGQLTNLPKDQSTKYAMRAWKARQAEVAKCSLCDGRGEIYSGDLMAPVGDCRTCPQCNGKRFAAQIAGIKGKQA